MMRDLPFQLLHPPNPPPDNFSELFRTPVNVDIGNYRKVELKDGVFGKKIEIKFKVCFIENHKSILHVIERSYEELFTFNRICFERRLISRNMKLLFPSMNSIFKSTTTNTTNNDQISNDITTSTALVPQRNSLIMSFGAAMGSPMKYASSSSSTNSNNNLLNNNMDKESVHALVIEIKAWLTELWNDQPLFHCVDYVRSFFELGDKVRVPVKPHLWYPTTLSVKKSHTSTLSSEPNTEIAARIVAEAAALSNTSPLSGSIDNGSREDAVRKSSSLVTFIEGHLQNFKKSHIEDEVTTTHFEDIEGKESTLRITFKDINCGLTIVNGEGSRDEYTGKFNGPLFVKESIGQAASLGVQVGDRIMAYNGKPVRKGLKSSEFKNKLKRKGRPITLTLCRKVKASPNITNDLSIKVNGGSGKEPEDGEDDDALNDSLPSSPTSDINEGGAEEYMPSKEMPTTMVPTSTSYQHIEVPQECICRVEGSRLHFVEIYENQRFSVLLEPSWGALPFPRHMLPSDRSAWSNEDGTVGVAINFEETGGNGDLSCLKAPSPFEWSGEWEIDLDYTSCDDEGFAYALDFWLLSSMQREGSSLKQDADACFTRRRRWRRTLSQLNPSSQPTPCLSALSMVAADGKGVYSRRAVALALNIKHRVTLHETTEDAYQSLQHILGCDGFEALWRGCGIAIITSTHRSAKALARALTSSGWPAMVFTPKRTTSLVDDTGSVHAPRIFISTDHDIKSSLEETVQAATKANETSDSGGDGIPSMILPMPIDMIIHFDLPKDFGTFLRRIERVFRSRLLEVSSNLKSIVLCSVKSNIDHDALIPWLAALVSDADQLEESPCLAERVPKLKQSLAVVDNNINKDDVTTNSSSNVASSGLSASIPFSNALTTYVKNDDDVNDEGKRWSMFGAVGSVLSYNFGTPEKNDFSDDNESDDGGIDVEDEGSTLYMNDGASPPQGQEATMSPFIGQGVRSSILEMNLPLFSAVQEEDDHTSESGNSGEDF